MSLSKKYPIELYSDFIDQSDKIILEFSGSGIKFYCVELLKDEHKYILNGEGKKEFYLSKNKKKEEKLFKNEEYNNILEELYGEKLYIFISNGHVEAIKKKTEFSQISREILKIIKEIDNKSSKYFKDLDLDIDKLEGKTTDYSDLSKQHYYGPETEDRLEANAFATLFEEGKIKAVEKIDYPYCLLFAGSTTIQVMRIDKVNNKIEYESATKPYVGLRDIIYKDNDPFMNLLLNNKIVFFGSNFAWVFLYKKILSDMTISDMTMKKVELLGEGAIQIEGEEDSFQFNADFTSYYTCENDKEKCGSKEERLVEYKTKPNCCYSTIKGESWRGFSNFCSIIFHYPELFFKSKLNLSQSNKKTSSRKLIPNFYFFKTINVGKTDDLDIDVVMGLIYYINGKINVPLTGNTLPNVQGFKIKKKKRNSKKKLRKKKKKRTKKK